MAGIEDLGEMLRNLSVGRRPGTWTMASIGQPDGSPVGLSDEVAAVIAEAEGVTVVCTVAEAKRKGWPVDFRAAWLTLEIHSSLEGVGLTAAVSTALADHHIPANMIAGYYHDHILVPEDQADAAMRIITELASAE
jgi:hypothetical protein